MTSAVSPLPSPTGPGEALVPLASVRLSNRASTAATPDGAARAAAAWFATHFDSDLRVMELTLEQSDGRWSARVHLRERLCGSTWRHEGRGLAGDSRSAAVRAVTDAVTGQHGLAVAGLRRLVATGAAAYGIVIAPGPGAVMVGRPRGDEPGTDELADVLMAVPEQAVAEIETDAGLIFAGWMRPVAVVTVAAPANRGPIGRWIGSCGRAAAQGDLW